MSVRWLSGAVAGSLLLTGPPAAAAEPRPTLHMWEFGAPVADVQRRLNRLGYRTDPTGAFDESMMTALWAFQKVNGIRPESRIDERTWQALDRPRTVVRLRREKAAPRVQIDLGRQLLTVYREGRPVLVTHISTGTDKKRGHTKTPKGSFRFYKRRNKWHKSRLGWMYKPLYFRGGYSMHGSTKVPLEPVSHGCVRLPMSVADEVAGLVRLGDRVYVGRSRAQKGDALRRFDELRGEVRRSGSRKGRRHGGQRHPAPRAEGHR